MSLPPLGPEGFAAQVAVSRETLARLTLHLDLLRRWQGAINLVGRTTLADPWRRHMLDSAQLFEHVPRDVTSVVDLGSGAGFPGLVLALMGVPEVHLIESDRRKAAFLREVARQTGAPVVIHARRIEDVAAWPAPVITSRALAPLPRLLTLAQRFLGSDSVCLFSKGEKVDDELTDAREHWHMEVERLPSRSAVSGVVLKLRGICRARDRQS